MNRLKKLEIRTSIVFNLFFLNNTVLLCFFFLWLIYILILTVVVQSFISTAELLIPTGRATNEVNAEYEMQPVTVETKISNCTT